MNKGIAGAIVTLVPGVVALAVPAIASADQVECASEKGRRHDCPMDTRGEVRIVRQLSRAPCVEGQSYGISKHSVWVQDGCRAVFASEGGGQNYGAPAYGAQQYGGQGGGAPATVTCESGGGKRTDCDMDTSGEIRISRQLSKAPCIEGQSYGIAKHSVWVSNGCRATFQNVSRANEGGGRNDPRGYDSPTPQQIEACRQRAGGYASVVRQEALRPGSWEIVLRNDNGEFACDVGPNGQVDGFQRLQR